MSDRIYFVADAKITTDLLNSAFDYAETAERRILSDLGVRGILHGMEPTMVEGGGLRVVVAPGIAYDNQGRRVCVKEVLVVDCSPNQWNQHGGKTRAQQERWLSICLRFKQVPGEDDEQVLGPGGEETYQRFFEAFSVEVRQGNPAQPGQATKPILRSDDVLICDIHLRAGQDAIGQDCIDVSRRSTPELWRAQYLSTDAFRWRALEEASTVQEALDATDRILGQQGNASGIKVDDTRWSHLPLGDSVQKAFAGVDASLAELAEGAHAAATRADTHETAIAAANQSTTDQGKRVDGVVSLFIKNRDALVQKTEEHTQALQRAGAILSSLTISPRAEAARLDQILFFEGTVSAPYGSGDWFNATIKVPGLTNDDRILSILPHPGFGFSMFCQYRSHNRGEVHVRITKMGTLATNTLTFYVIAGYNSAGRSRPGQ